jgi:hypothetical protein
MKGPSLSLVRAFFFALVLAMMGSVAGVGEARADASAVAPDPVSPRAVSLDARLSGTR